MSRLDDVSHAAFGKRAVWASSSTETANKGSCMSIASTESGSNCPDCAGLVSVRVDSCVHCGAAQSHGDQRPGDPRVLRPDAHDRCWRGRVDGEPVARFVLERVNQ